MSKVFKGSVMAGVIAGAMLASTAALAELTANVAATSNYVWRGLTQTDDGPALQGGIDYAHDSGLYAGAWASNVDFPDADIGGLEYDLFAGFANQVGEFGYDLAYLTYNYTDSDADNANEIKFGVSYGPASLNYYRGDTGADAANEYDYYELGAEFGLPAEVSLALHYGIMSGDAAEDDAGDDEKTDYSISVGKDFAGVNVSLGYADHEDDDGLVFVTVSKEFSL